MASGQAATCCEVERPYLEPPYSRELGASYIAASLEHRQLPDPHLFAQRACAEIQRGSVTDLSCFLWCDVGHPKASTVLPRVLVGPLSLVTATKQGRGSTVDWQHH